MANSLTSVAQAATQFAVNSNANKDLSRTPNTKIITTIPSLADINITSSVDSLQNDTNFFEILPATTATFQTGGVNTTGTSTSLITVNEVQIAVNYRNAFKSGAPLTEYCNFFNMLQANLANVSAGSQSVPLDGILFWVKKYFALPNLTSFLNSKTSYLNVIRSVSTLNSIQLNSVLLQFKSDPSSLFYSFSDSIGLLANSKFHQLDSTAPIADISQQLYGVPIPFSANMENKVGNTSRNLMYNLSKGCTALMRHNLFNVAYTGAINLKNIPVDGTLAHGLNLINDSAFFVNFNKATASRASIVESVFSGLGGKLSSFVKFCNTIGNNSALNLRDVYAPIDGYDKDFTVKPTSTDLSISSEDQSILNNQLNEQLAFDQANNDILRNLYGPSANLQASPYLLDKTTILKGPEYIQTIGADGSITYTPSNGAIFGPNINQTHISESTGGGSGGIGNGVITGGSYYASPGVTQALSIIGTGETGFNENGINGATSNANNQRENNATIRKLMNANPSLSLAAAQAIGGDYGYFQNNSQNSDQLYNALIKNGFDDATASYYADALSNGGGKGNADTGQSYSVQDQAQATAYYMQYYFPKQYNLLNSLNPSDPNYQQNVESITATMGIWYGIPNGIASGGSNPSSRGVQILTGGTSSTAPNAPASSSEPLYDTNGNYVGPNSSVTPAAAPSTQTTPSSDTTSIYVQGNYVGYMQNGAFTLDTNTYFVDSEGLIHAKSYPNEIGTSIGVIGTETGTFKPVNAPTDQNNNIISTLTTTDQYGQIVGALIPVAGGPAAATAAQTAQTNPQTAETTPLQATAADEAGLYNGDGATQVVNNSPSKPNSVYVISAGTNDGTENFNTNPNYNGTGNNYYTVFNNIQTMIDNAPAGSTVVIYPPNPGNPAYQAVIDAANDRGVSIINTSGLSYTTDNGVPGGAHLATDASIKNVANQINAIAQGAPVTYLTDSRVTQLNDIGLVPGSAIIGFGQNNSGIGIQAKDGVSGASTRQLVQLQASKGGTSTPAPITSSQTSTQPTSQAQPTPTSGTPASLTKVYENPNQNTATVPSAPAASVTSSTAAAGAAASTATLSLTSSAIPGLTPSIAEAGLASNRPFSNRQRAVPLIFTIRVEDISGKSPVRISVDYLLKKVVLNNANTVKTNYVLNSNNVNAGTRPLSTGNQGQTAESLVQRIQQYVSRGLAAASATLKNDPVGVLSSLGIKPTDPIFGAVTNQITNIFKQQTLTSSSFNNLLGSLVNAASTRLPGNLAVDFSASTAVYDTLAGQVGAGILPSSSQIGEAILSTLNPFNYIDINGGKPLEIPSISLGSIGNILTLTQNFVTTGGYTSPSSIIDFISAIKDQICTFAVPVIDTINKLKLLLTNKTKPIDIPKLLSNYLHDLGTRIANFFTTDNIYKTIVKPLEDAIAQYFVNLYKKLFVCDQNTKSNKSGKKTP